MSVCERERVNERVCASMCQGEQEIMHDRRADRDILEQKEGVGGLCETEKERMFENAKVGA